MYKKKVAPECINNYYLTPSTVNCNEQMYGRTLIVASIQCKSSTHRG